MSDENKNGSGQGNVDLNGMAKGAHAAQNAIMNRAGKEAGKEVGKEVGKNVAKEGAKKAGEAAAGPVGAGLEVADQAKKNAEGGTNAMATCITCNTSCYGCCCGLPAFLFILLVSLVVSLSPTYLLGNFFSDLGTWMGVTDAAEEQRQQEMLEQFSDKLLDAYIDCYNDTYNSMLMEIGEKTTAYRNANAIEGAEEYLTISDIIGGKLHSTGAAYAFDNQGFITTINGREIAVNFEYQIIVPEALATKTVDRNAMKKIANVPYLVAIYDYYKEQQLKRDNWWDRFLGKVGDKLHFSKEYQLQNEIINKLTSTMKSQNGTDNGLFGYVIVESDKAMLNGELVDVKYKYNVKTLIETGVYKPYYTDNSTPYYTIYSDDNPGNNMFARKHSSEFVTINKKKVYVWQLKFTDKNESGAQKLNVSFKDKADCQNFVSMMNEKYGSTDYKLACQYVSTGTKEDFSKIKTVNGVFYTGTLYMGSLFDLAQNAFGVDLSDKDIQEETGYTAATFESYSEREMDTKYLNGDYYSITSCNGHEIPSYFATEEKTNYGLVAWAKMACTYDPNTTDKFGIDSLSRWGYIWGNRGSVFTAERYLKIGEGRFNGGNADDHYDNPETYAAAAQWIGRRAADCNGLCVGYPACYVNDKGKIAFKSKGFAYGVGGTVDNMKAEGKIFAPISEFDGKIVGQVLIQASSDDYKAKTGKTFKHIGIYAGYNEITQKYEVIHASGEQVGVIKSSYDSLEALKGGSWTHYGEMHGVTYYPTEETIADAKAKGASKAELDELQNKLKEGERASAMASAAIKGVVRSVDKPKSTDTADKGK